MLHLRSPNVALQLRAVFSCAASHVLFLHPKPRSPPASLGGVQVPGRRHANRPNITRSTTRTTKELVFPSFRRCQHTSKLLSNVRKVCAHRCSSHPRPTCGSQCLTRQHQAHPKQPRRAWDIGEEKQGPPRRRWRFMDLEIILQEGQNTNGKPSASPRPPGREVVKVAFPGAASQR